MTTVREGAKRDMSGIKIINNKACWQSNEGNVIDKIRALDSQILSLVAAIDNIVDNIFFSTVVVVCSSKKSWNGISSYGYVTGVQKNKE